jgi:serine phosphatase RsbU (regulator of sigma subunit)
MFSPEGSASPSAATGRRGARRSIANRLRWSYLLSSTLPLLVVGGLLLYISLTAQQTNVYNDQRGVALGVARDISRYIGDMQRQIESYALQVRPGIPTAQLLRGAQDLAARNFPDLIEIAVFNERAVELVRVYRLQAAPAEQLAPQSDDPAIATALRQGLVSISPIILGDDGRPAFTITMPVRNDGGAVIGAIRTTLRAEPVVQALQLAASDSSYAYLVNGADGSVMLDDGEPGFVPSPEIAALLVAPDGVAEYAGARDAAVVGAIRHVTDTLDRPIGWAVVAEQPAARAFAPVRRSAVILTTLVVVVGMFALLWALQQARQFLVPLTALRSGATALGNGDLSYRLAHLGGDELGDVAAAFNQMADHLEQSRAAIERQNEDLRRGLALARDIQVGLLPTRPPWGEEALTVYARSIPAYDVGGDFYTYLALPSGRVAVAIGDISGKGIGAALIMALTSSAVESQGRQIESPAHVLTALNQILAPRLKANHMNAAVLFAVFDPNDWTMRIANAGMIAPIVISNEGSRFIEVGGFPIGSFAAAVYREEIVRLAPGDMVLLVSDGVVEAHNDIGELFGFEQLEETIAGLAPSGNVRAIVEHVLERVYHHTGDADQHDDITIIAVRPPMAAERATREDDHPGTVVTL